MSLRGNKTKIGGTATCGVVVVVEYREFSIKGDVVHQDAIRITGSGYSYINYSRCTGRLISGVCFQLKEHRSTCLLV